MKKYGFIGAVLLAISIFMLGGFSLEVYKERRLQKEIASEILRFHVLADSDEKEDQQQKMQVKHAVVEYLQPILKEVKSKAETVEVIQKEIFNIEEIAQGMAETRCVTVSLEEDWFPAISYGDCTFPAGMYDTLQIKIGEAKGHNWWCVLYPGLCFSNAIKPVATSEDKEVLKHILDEECYDFLLRPAKTKLQFRLFGLEFFGWNK